jgi:hypothetical protein
VGYQIEVEGGGPPVVDLPADDHEALADAIIRAAGGLRRLRRLVDAEREARFDPDDLPWARHELDVLADALEPEDRPLLLPWIDRLRAVFERGEREGRAVVGR